MEEDGKKSWLRRPKLCKRVVESYKKKVCHLLLFFHVQPVNQPKIMMWCLAIKGLDAHGLDFESICFSGCPDVGIV